MPARLIEFPSKKDRDQGGWIKGTRCGCCGGQLYYDGAERDVVCLSCARRKAVRLVSERVIAWDPDNTPAA